MKIVRKIKGKTNWEQVGLVQVANDLGLNGATTDNSLNLFKKDLAIKDITLGDKTYSLEKRLQNKHFLVFESNYTLNVDGYKNIAENIVEEYASRLNYPLTDDIKEYDRVKYPLIDDTDILDTIIYRCSGNAKFIDDNATDRKIIAEIKIPKDETKSGKAEIIDMSKYYTYVLKRDYK